MNNYDPTNSDLLHENERLKEQLNFYKLIADYTYDWELFLNHEGKIEYISPAFERITHLKRNEIIAHKTRLWDIVHPNDTNLLRAAHESLKASNKVEDLEFRITRPDGSVRFVSMMAQPVFQDDKWVGSRASIRDVTEQKDFVGRNETQVRLKESEYKFSQMVLAAPVAIFITNALMQIRFANPASGNLLGISTKELIEKSVPDLLAEPDSITPVDFVAAHIEHGIKNLERRIQHKNGDIIWCIIDSVMISDNEFLTFMKDIGARKKTEETLKHQNEEFASLNEEYLASLEELRFSTARATSSEKKYLQAYQDLLKAQKIARLCVWKWYVTQDRLILSNLATDLWGIPSADLDTSMYSWATRYIHRDDLVVFRKITDESQQGKLEQSIEFRLVLADGSVRNIWSELVELGFDDKVESKVFSGVLQDITERKQIENELRKAKLKAEESDRLKSAFLQNLSHEIRTPMNAIVGFTDLITKESLSFEKRKTYSNFIHTNSRYLLNLIDDVLTIAALETKQESLILSPTNINTLLLELTAEFNEKSVARKNQLHTKRPLKNPAAEVMIDGQKLHKILYKLLSNAIKFTSAGFIEIGYQLTEGMLEFFVNDTGIGIAPELHGVIFERFRQADPKIASQYGGTGVGLAICKGLVELMGGKIELKSNTGQGARFSFRIPYRPVTEPLELEEMESKTNYTIVVAEDQESNYQLIEEIQSDSDYRVVHCRNGQEAVQYCKAHPEISLVLMDIKMPVMDGNTAAILIKSALPDLPIVAQTAYVFEREMRFVDTQVFDAYITKPIQENELLKIIKKFLQ